MTPELVIPVPHAVFIAHIFQFWCFHCFQHIIHRIAIFRLVSSAVAQPARIPLPVYFSCHISVFIIHLFIDDSIFRVFGHAQAVLAVVFIAECSCLVWFCQQVAGEIIRVSIRVSTLGFGQHAVHGIIGVSYAVSICICFWYDISDAVICLCWSHIRSVMFCCDSSQTVQPIVAIGCFIRIIRPVFRVCFGQQISHQVIFIWRDNFCTAAALSGIRRCYDILYFSIICVIAVLSRACAGIIPLLGRADYISVMVILIYRQPPFVVTDGFYQIAAGISVCHFIQFITCTGSLAYQIIWWIIEGLFHHMHIAVYRRRFFRQLVRWSIFIQYTVAALIGFTRKITRQVILIRFGMIIWVSFTYYLIESIIAVADWYRAIWRLLLGVGLYPARQIICKGIHTSVWIVDSCRLVKRIMIGILCCISPLVGQLCQIAHDIVFIIFCIS